ncbi:MAG: hypothetical protein DCC68_19290 [Planctomycetota bacterium]|nr:MAG: hypothetical protein DCC68_19290 [Planctomycetota bacterium]
MCYFLSLGIAACFREKVEETGRGRRGLSVAPAANPSVVALFPRGDAVFDVTRGGCSCDLVASEPPPRAVDEARLREGYRKQGWSAAKIERAVRQAALHAARSAEREASGESIAEQFRELVANLAERTGGVRLFVHMFDGDQTCEHVKSSGQVTMSINEFRGGAELVEDVLISLVPSKALR